MKIRKIRKFWLWGAGAVMLIVAVVNIFLGEYNNAACSFLWLAVLIIDQKNLLDYEEIIDWQDEVIQNVREEIERLQDKTSIGLNAYSMGYENGKAETCSLLRSFINSLPKEQVGEGLEEASERYACRYSDSKYGHDKIKKAYTAGAQWDREQMLKDAVEEEVFDGSFAEQVGELPVVQYAITPDDNLKIGDKVKLIIVKEVYNDR